jgi:catechol 2,3-dioxygenase-like lactoylglutathione lyase family enzyme
MAVQITSVNHFAVSVQDLEESIEWYNNVLGFTLICQNTIPQLDVNTAHLRAPGFVLELFEAKGANPLPKDRMFPNTDLMTHGNKHFAVTVEDAEKAMKQLNDLGVEIVMTAEVWGTFGIFIRDPTGNLIELFEGDMRDHQE